MLNAHVKCPCFQTARFGIYRVVTNTAESRDIICFRLSPHIEKIVIVQDSSDQFLTLKKVFDLYRRVYDHT